MVAKACIQNTIQFLDYCNHQTTNWKQQKSIDWLQYK